MITVNKTDFLNAIKSTRPCVAKMNINPIINCIHLQTLNGALFLTATDTTISAKSFCEASIDEDIDICINAEKLESIVGKLDDFISIDVQDTIVEIKSGETVFKLLKIVSKDYPEVKFETEDATHINVNPKDFVKGIEKALIATSNEENYILNSVCLTLTKDGYELASTDGNRLCQIKCIENNESEGQYIIPQKILNILLKNVESELDIYLQKNNIIFKTSKCILKQGLFPGIYPKYQQLIPTDLPMQVVVDKNLLLQSLEKVAIMCDDRTNITTFDFQPNSLYINASCDNGSAKDCITTNGEANIKIAFNYKYILAGIKVMEASEIVFEMNTNMSACLIKGDFTYLVMPVRPQENIDKN